MDTTDHLMIVKFLISMREKEKINIEILEDDVFHEQQIVQSCDKNNIVSKLCHMKITNEINTQSE